MAAGVPGLGAGLVLVPPGVPLPALPSSVTVLQGGHPVPSREGLAASRRILDAVAALGRGDCLLYLVSGGTSALLEVPRPGLDDDDVIRVYRLLLGSGAPIEEVNLVRGALSKVKHGGLARAAYPAVVRTLVVSDVIGDDPAVVGSGPTVGSAATAAEAVAVLERHGLWPRVPVAVRRWLESSTEPHGGPVCDGGVEVVVGMDAGDEASRSWLSKHGYAVVDPPLERLEGDVCAAARKIADGLVRLAGRGRSAFVLSGETTVRLPRRVGRGGRNQHLAAAVARCIAGVDGVALMAGGTDGIDGNSAAAGAVVDGGSAARARRAGMDLQRALDAFDSSTALDAAGDTIKTGPTGANLADLVVAVAQGPF